MALMWEDPYTRGSKTPDVLQNRTGPGSGMQQPPELFNTPAGPGEQAQQPMSLSDHVGGYLSELLYGGKDAEMQGAITPEQIQDRINKTDSQIQQNLNAATEPTYRHDSLGPATQEELNRLPSMQDSPATLQNFEPEPVGPKIRPTVQDDLPDTISASGPSTNQTVPIVPSEQQFEQRGGGAPASKPKDTGPMISTKPGPNEPSLLGQGIATIGAVIPGGGLALDALQLAGIGEGSLQGQGNERTRQALKPVTDVVNQGAQGVISGVKDYLIPGMQAAGTVMNQGMQSLMTPGALRDALNPNVAREENPNATPTVTPGDVLRHPQTGEPVPTGIRLGNNLTPQAPTNPAASLFGQGNKLILPQKMQDRLANMNPQARAQAEAKIRANANARMEQGKFGHLKQMGYTPEQVQQIRNISLGRAPMPGQQPAVAGPGPGAGPISRGAGAAVGGSISGAMGRGRRGGGGAADMPLPQGVPNPTDTFRGTEDPTGDPENPLSSLGDFVNWIRKRGIPGA